MWRGALILNQERCSHSTKRNAVSGELEVAINTLGQEVFHVVSHRSRDNVSHFNSALFMITSEVHSNGCRSFNVKTLPDQRPTLIKVVLRASHFEIINVHNEKQAKLRVEVARRPLLSNGLKANARDVVVAMHLPHSTAVWVPI